MDPYGNCEHFLHWHRPRPAGELFTGLARYSEAHGLEPDVYGRGDFLNEFEQEIAGLLGKAAGLFCISGVMAQQIALRIWCEARDNRNIAFHPTSHLEVNEHHAYARLQGLDGHLIGDPREPLRTTHVESCTQPLAALLVELPLRHLGGVLPSWEELEALKTHCRQHDVRMHLDGARLWECTPFYGRTLAEICEGFDSVYVSFYKGLGALGGAMLLGPADFIDEARTWLRRMGGNLYTVHPYAVSAKLNFDENRDIAHGLVAKARNLADGIRSIGGIRAIPDPPQVNMLHIACEAPAEQMNRARDRIAVEDRVWLSGNFRDAEVAGAARAEIYLTRDAEEIPDERALALLEKLARLGTT